ncbi:MAG: leucyl/phenylalanyl-tRNA--protein transferase [Planktomarina sp.]
MDGAELSPDLMLHAYANGVFPMADGADLDDLFWIDPKRRGVFPLDRFRLSRSTARHMRKAQPIGTINSDFSGVVQHCANRSETWINAPLHQIYQDLNRAGFAHSVEVWEDGELAGAVFGLSLGAAFFGESMVSLRTNGSKMALTFLVDHLRRNGFTLFDTQFITDHLASLGAVEISRASYRSQLAVAIDLDRDFLGSKIADYGAVLHRMTQTS